MPVSLRHTLGMILLLGIILVPAQVWGQAKEWQEAKGEHFVVYYQNPTDAAFVQSLLRQAETYYRRIGDQVGYARYSQFWTWNERVKILLFQDREAFLARTGFPEWSNGYSDRDSSLFRSRVIITYRQEKEFLDGLLPHEISHLVLHDYIPAANLPIWFDEGVAQLQEKGKSEFSRSVVRARLGPGQLLPFSVLFNKDIRQERDPKIVRVFYAQSKSLVEFLLTQYGVDAFQRLCRDLRDQRSFSAALPHAYTNQITSLEDLEKKWRSYISR